MFESYPRFEYPMAAVQLSLAMLGMGTRLGLKDFRDIAKRPQGIFVALLLQFAVVPAVALALDRGLHLSDGIAVGLVLVAAMPSGSLSNIFSYLGRGQVALAISITIVSTLGCLALTPLVVSAFAGLHLQDFRMPMGEIVAEIACYLLAPLAVGMAIGRFLPRSADQIGKWAIRASLFVVLLILVGSVGSGRLDLRAYGWLGPLAVLLLGVLSQLASVLLSRLLRFDAIAAFTIGTSVLLRNCNLAVMLKASLFPADSPHDAEVGDGTLFAALLYGGISLGIAGAAVARRRWSEARATNKPGATSGPAPGSS